MLLYISLLLLSQECLQFMWTVLQLHSWCQRLTPTPTTLDPFQLPSLMSIFKSPNSIILLYGFPHDKERDRVAEGDWGIGKTIIDLSLSGRTNFFQAMRKMICLKSL